MKNFSLNEFISTVRQDGIARQNRFWIQIDIPRNLYGASGAIFKNGGGRSSIEKLHLLCKSVNLNGVQVASTPVRLTGETHEVPWGRTFSPSTMMFYVDKNFIVRQFFEDWISTIQNPESRELAYRSEYTTTVTINILDRTEDGPRYKITLHDVFPKSVGNLMLDQEVPSIMILDVLLDFRYYRVEMLNTVPATGSGVPGAAESLIPIENGIENLNSNFTNLVQKFNGNFIEFQTIFNDRFNNFALSTNFLENNSLSVNASINTALGSVGLNARKFLS